MHLDKWMACKQADAVLPAAKRDGWTKKALHATVVGKLGDKVTVVLMAAVCTMREVVHFLQSNKVGLILLDKRTDLLQTGIMPGMQVQRHHTDGVVMLTSNSHHPNQQSQQQKQLTYSHKINL